MKSSGLNLPDFIVIGAARSGTTTLYEYLKLHPDIVMSTPKEPAFFAVDKFYNKGIKWYSNLFGSVGQQQLCGEASTHYTVDPYTAIAAKRIHERLPHVKLIYIMRSPIDRCYSHYTWEVLWAQLEYNALHDIGLIPLDAEGCFKRPPDSWKPWRFAPTFERSLEVSSDFFINTSRYIDNIREYLKYFPRESLLCLLFRDLKNNPKDFLNQFFNFLGVRQFPFQDAIVANPAQEYRERLVRQQLKKSFIGISAGQQAVSNRLLSAIPSTVKEALSAMLARTSKGRQAIKAVKKKAFVKPLCSETRAKLVQEFEEANQELSEFLDRDLSHWDG